MFMDQKTQYCPNIHNTKTYLDSMQSTKILMVFPQEKNAKIHIEPQKTSIFQAIFNKKSKDGVNSLPDFKLYCKGSVMKGG
jgi:hypothetical protein